MGIYPVQKNWIEIHGFGLEMEYFLTIIGVLLLTFSALMLAYFDKELRFLTEDQRKTFYYLLL
jgi:hypothetical protein